MVHSGCSRILMQFFPTENDNSMKIACVTYITGLQRYPRFPAGEPAFFVCTSLVARFVARALPKWTRSPALCIKIPSTTDETTDRICNRVLSHLDSSLAGQRLSAAFIVSSNCTLHQIYQDILQVRCIRYMKYSRTADRGTSVHSTHCFGGTDNEPLNDGSLRATLACCGSIRT